MVVVSVKNRKCKKDFLDYFLAAKYMEVLVSIQKKKSIIFVYLSVFWAKSNTRGKGLSNSIISLIAKNFFLVWLSAFEFGLDW